MNTYAYVGGNPVGGIDRSGRGYFISQGGAPLELLTGYGHLAYVTDDGTIIQMTAAGLQKNRGAPPDTGWLDPVNVHIPYTNIDININPAHKIDPTRYDDKIVTKIYEQLTKERGLNKGFPPGSYPLNNCINVALEARNRAQALIDGPSETTGGDQLPGVPLGDGLYGDPLTFDPSSVFGGN